MQRSRLCTRSCILPPTMPPPCTAPAQDELRESVEHAVRHSRAFRDWPAASSHNKLIGQLNAELG